MVDKTQRPPITAAVKGKVVISNFRMKVAKMKDFLTVLSKAETFIFEYTNRCGTITLEYAPLKDFKARGICEILAELMKFDSELQFDAPAAFLTEIHADVCGIRRPLTSQMKDKTLYVNNIRNDTTEELLKGLVPDCINAIIPVNSEGNRKGWAVLEFKNTKDADDAMRNVREIDLGADHKVIISRAESSDPKEVAEAFEKYKKNPPKPPPAQQNKAKKENEAKKQKPKQPWNQDKSLPNTFTNPRISSDRGFGRTMAGKPGSRGVIGGGRGSRGMSQGKFGSGGMASETNSFHKTMGGIVGSRGGMLGGNMRNRGNMEMDIGSNFGGNRGGGGMGRRMNRSGFLDSQDEDFNFGGPMTKDKMLGDKKEAMVEFLQDALAELKSSKRGRGGMAFRDDQGGEFGGGGYDEYEEVPHKRGRFNEDSYGNDEQQNWGPGRRQGLRNQGGGGLNFQQNQGGSFGSKRDMSGNFNRGGMEASDSSSLRGESFGRGGGSRDSSLRGSGLLGQRGGYKATGTFGQGTPNKSGQFGQGTPNKSGQFGQGNHNKSGQFGQGTFNKSGQFGKGSHYESGQFGHDGGIKDNQNVPFGQGDVRNQRSFGNGPGAVGKRNTASFGLGGNQFAGSNQSGNFSSGNYDDFNQGGDFNDMNDYSYNEGYQQSGNINEFGAGDDYQSWGKDYQSLYNDDQYYQQQYGSYDSGY